MIETPEARLKRISMRSHRRGIKEMDLILGAYARDRLSGMDDGGLLLYDTMLAENDQDLLLWVTGQAPVPDKFSALIADIAAHANAV